MNEEFPMQRRLSFAMAVLATLLTTLLTPVAALAQSKTLRIVPHTNITILDPIWSSAFVTRNHGYMVYDTLFGTDAEGRIKPQMVQSWSVSPDKKAWTFKLRDGLEFHDGKPVTSQDVVASIKRWASRDSFGGVMARSVETYETPDARTFVVKLKEPFGLMLEALGKPSSLVPFIMPARIAATSGSEQIKEFIGSGPYRFVDAEYRPGERLVYAKNAKYQPRGEPPSGTAGGKNVYVDRAEWVIIRDPQTQYSALLAGEVDIVEQPTFEQYPALKAARGIKLVDAQPAGQMFYLRFNHLHPPFDNVKIRQAGRARHVQAVQELLRLRHAVLERQHRHLHRQGGPGEGEEDARRGGLQGREGRPAATDRSVVPDQGPDGGETAMGGGGVQGRPAAIRLGHGSRSPRAEGPRRKGRMERLRLGLDGRRHPQPAHHRDDERLGRQGFLRLAG